MHDATTPPLITYEANYKRRPSSSGAYTHRKERFTDREYNAFITGISDVADATTNKKGRFRLMTPVSNESNLANLAKKILAPPYIWKSSLGYITLGYGTGENASSLRDAARAKVEKMLKHGIIAYYGTDNPLYAYTKDGYLVEGITKSLDYVNTAYDEADKDLNLGGKDDKDAHNSPDRETYLNKDYLKNENEDAKKQERKKRIIIISIVAVAIVGFIVLAILKKKGKI